MSVKLFLNNDSQKTSYGKTTKSAKTHFHYCFLLEIQFVEVVCEKIKGYLKLFKMC